MLRLRQLREVAERAAAKRADAELDRTRTLADGSGVSIYSAPSRGGATPKSCRRRCGSTVANSAPAPRRRPTQPPEIPKAPRGGFEHRRGLRSRFRSAPTRAGKVPGKGQLHKVADREEGNFVLNPQPPAHAQALPPVIGWPAELLQQLAAARSKTVARNVLGLSVSALDTLDEDAAEAFYVAATDTIRELPDD